MQEAILSDYFYGDEAEQFTYFRIPRQLITDVRFKHLSTDAKLLYGMLLDRMGLSRREYRRKRPQKKRRPALHKRDPRKSAGLARFHFRRRSLSRSLP